MGKPLLRVGLIGSGFMGRAHAFAYATAEKVFDLPFRIRLAVLADATPEAARAGAEALGFDASTADWRAVAEGEDVDVVHVTTPNALHAEMAIAALEAGKPVHCEKPLAPTLAEAVRMAEAAERAALPTQVGFNYLCNPMVRLAARMIEDGAIGAVRTARFVHAEDYMADASVPWGFRHDPVGGGVLADLGSHALATAEFLLGRVGRVLGDCVTVIAERPAEGGPRPVVVDDVARAFLRFVSGASASLEASWIATGRTMQHDFEIHGERGAIRFTQERLNELHLYLTRDPDGLRGFRRIEAGPAHPPYGRFCVAPGHQLGFNDLKAIEIAGFLDAVAGQAPAAFPFSRGARIQALVEAVARSSAMGVWTEPG
ncbi:Gfo/Idh/MocA family protein [Rubellimicrobium sp. CFH 75288]|uniref:Gfo/Idh/MocA family protein n=1 Tax=Rubellimicrobium sp. CFH 75288 TaxID=2697034 RepID=UPI0014131792|nr:Gfo/Idh/MocA family oxidoreductase [Rubellimicrobium sp. CFH 75288]NAZ37052.1 Gfo/Idh/MocA family oxidoreductase [Rubellimicrobium sp. CFH 75288]